MAIRIIDDAKLQNIAVAIQAKDNGGHMTVDEMPGRIEAILNPALALWDWEGTKLAEYSRQGALALTELPAPSTLPMYAAVDHELLVFQSWNWNLTNIKAWLQAHAGETLYVGAIYTTTDGQDHNYWGNPRLGTATTINMQKRGTASISDSAFDTCRSLTQINIPDSVTSISDSAFASCYSLTRINIPDSVTSIEYGAFASCYSLTRINIPDSVTSIGGGAFQSCYSLTQINIPDSVTSIRNNAFRDCYSLCDILVESKSTLSNVNAFDSLPSIYRVYVPRANLSWHETETNWSTIYAQGHIVAIEDYIAYLESIGFNVDKYKEAA